MRQVTFTPSGDRVGAVGFGAMGLSWVYDRQGLTERQKHEVLHLAVDLGMTFVDTAVLYGGGANEELVGAALGGRRDEVFLCSKTGLRAASLEPPRTERCGRPEEVRRSIDDSLRRLRTDAVDLYYLHRVDPDVPLEDTWGAMAELVTAGKVRHLGLSEVSTAQAERAHAIHPVAAVQSEYSLWTRNPDGSGPTSDGEPSGDVISWCAGHGAVFVPFSPLGRGYLAGALAGRTFSASDFRSRNPRFTPEAMAANEQRVLGPIREVARRHGVSLAEVAIAWAAARGEHMLPIPGTSDPVHVREDAAAAELRLTAEDLAVLDGVEAVGDRY
ncbi:oxidoreductase [Kocuria dechangensis]|uniref:Oxidoreductase n=1 Tax=Kocuria dechangensis TaxID=1176249 RepID=A0A917GQM5_9MICC|nr:aldo/keto reductase [Kocuria dechangensis]GGG54511.1 oxidoreductase [Kocuria dechangensis]